MSEKSDEELEGDVDHFDMDFDGDDKTTKKESLTSKACFKKTQVVPEKPKGKEVQGTVKRPKPVPTGQKKPNMKRKTPATVIPVGDDLLQAFAIGLPSIKMTSPVVNAQKKTNDLLQAFAIGLPSIKMASPVVNAQKKTNVGSKKVNSQNPATALFGEKGKKASAKENAKQEAKVNNSKKNIETDSVSNTPEVKKSPAASKQEQIKKPETHGKEKTNLTIEEKKETVEGKADVIPPKMDIVSKHSEINVSQNIQDSHHMNDRTKIDLKLKDSQGGVTKKGGYRATTCCDSMV